MNAVFTKNIFLFAPDSTNFEGETLMRHRPASIPSVAEQVGSPLEIVYREIDELIPEVKNARHHSKKQIAQIARSIQVFGFAVPFQIDRNSRLLAGHGRLAACQMLGIRRVPTICLEHLSEAQARAFAIAENKIAEGARWNRSRLAEELQFLSGINLEFDLETTGFEVREIELLINGVDSEPSKKTSAVEEQSNTRSEISVTGPNDLWILDNHRLICGNAWDEEAYSVLMNGRHAAAVFTQLPSGGNENRASLVKLFSQLCECCDPAAYQFVITEDLFITNVLVAAERAGLELADLCIAIKKTVQPGRLYKNQRDLIFLFEKCDVKPLIQPAFERTNVWRCPRPRSRGHGPQTATASLAQHSVPLPLVTGAITDCTAPGEIILDPFIGAGTTLFAAEQTGRICFAIESDPRQVDLAVQRWQQLTGTSAVHGGLVTQLEMMTSTELSGRGMCSISPFRNSTF